MPQYEVGKKYRIVGINEISDFKPLESLLLGQVVTVRKHDDGPGWVTVCEFESLPTELTSHWAWLNNHKSATSTSIYCPVLEEVMPAELKVGMRVRVVGKPVGVYQAIDAVGTIIVFNPDMRQEYNQNYGIEFDCDVPNGHDLGQLRMGSKRGLWVEPKLITPLESTPDFTALELAWGDYLDQDGDPAHEEAFKAGWEAALASKGATK